MRDVESPVDEGPYLTEDERFGPFSFVISIVEHPGKDGGFVDQIDAENQNDDMVMERMAQLSIEEKMVKNEYQTDDRRDQQGEV